MTATDRPEPQWDTLLTSRAGTPGHDYLCDAFLDWGGYALANDELVELLVPELVPGGGGIKWYARAVDHFGAA